MSTTAYQMLQRLKSVDLRAIAANIIDANRDEIAEMNRKQLRKGLNVFGKPLSPKYSEDPFFKSREAAKRYADWKKRLFPDMTYDVPNLIINGYYHQSISIQSVGQSVRFTASASFADAIAGKYNNTALGLTDENRDKAWQDIIKAPLVYKVSSITGCKIVNK